MFPQFIKDKFLSLECGEYFSLQNPVMGNLSATEFAWRRIKEMNTDMRSWNCSLPSSDIGQISV